MSRWVGNCIKESMPCREERGLPIYAYLACLIMIYLYRGILESIYVKTAAGKTAKDLKAHLQVNKRKQTRGEGGLYIDEVLVVILIYTMHVCM